MRVRENSEQIALLQGERAERQRLSERFSRVVTNWYGIMSRTKRLTAFTQSYSQAAVIFPMILAAPAYFADKIQLGALLQAAEAFGKVQEALSFFVSIYRRWRNGAPWWPVSTVLKRRSQALRHLRPALARSGN